MSDPQPVNPDAVHVWRGYRAAGKSPEDFAAFLGTVFVPACALLQPRAGLRAFIPSLPPQNGKPAGVPDQTALMFWADQQTYADAFKTLAVRAYTNLHGDAYGPPSQAQFPLPLAPDLVAEQPYYLVDAPADWMLGTVTHFVGSRPTQQSTGDFLGALSDWAAARRQAVPPGIDGALLCAGNDYVAYWEHSAEAAPGAPGGGEDGLASVAGTVFAATAERLELGASLWDPWPGLDLVTDNCINIQLDRP